MTTPSNADILSAVFTVLKADSVLLALCPTIANHITQETPLPVMRARWQDAIEWDTKDSDGLTGFIVCDIWASTYGDLLGLQIADRVDTLLHKRTLTLTTGQSLVLRHASSTSFTEPDGLTHHTSIRFLHIATN